MAERLWATDKGLARPREREPMVRRLPRLQRFARGLKWLRDVDPERLDRLRHDVARYLSLIKLLGVREGDVPSRYRASSVLRYALVQSTLLVFVLPVAMVGNVYWAAPFLLTRRIARSFRSKLDQVATYKLSVAVLAFPVWLALTVVLLGLLVSWSVALGALVVLPVTGLAAVAWRERKEVVLEDVRVFLRATRRSDSRARVKQLRRRLAEDIDEVARLWQEERRERRDEAEGKDG